MFITNESNKTKNFETITANFTGNIRHDKMGGRDYLVAPMVMVVEGVLNGSKGPVLYKEEDLSKFPSAWNNKPVVVYHPQLGGQGVSACSPEVITSHGIGVIMNAKIEDVERTVDNETVTRKALKAEAWFEEDRANEIDERIMEAVNNNKPMELSTGLYIEIENETGQFDGKDYMGIAHNFQPDHLALLPDLEGACSIPDGAGFLMNEAGDGMTLMFNDFEDDQKEFLKLNKDLIFRAMSNRVEEILTNEMSHGNIRSLLGSLLRKDNDDLWIDEVFDNFFIYEDDGKLYMQDYIIESNAVSFVGNRIEIVRVTEFRTMDGRFIGNRKDQSMDKKKVVDGLIANEKNSWSEDDREVLMAMNEATLEKVAEKSKEADPAENTQAEAETSEGSDTTAEVKNMTTKEYIANAPPEIKEVLENSTKMLEQAKTSIIEKLVANDACTFTEEFLKRKDLEELQNMLALAGGKVEEAPIIRFNYIGQGDGPTENVVAGEALEILPVVMAD